MHNSYEIKENTNYSKNWSNTALVCNPGISSTGKMLKLKFLAYEQIKVQAVL